MPMRCPIRGALFDSAEVLMRPLGTTVAPPAEAWRRWFPGPRFDELVRDRYPDLAFDRLWDAVTAGMEYLDDCHQQGITTIAAEQSMFAAFYCRVLEDLGMATPPAALTDELAQARVHAEQMEPYPDTVATLDRLRAAGLRLGVLSEAWPSLAIHYERAGLRPYFQAFVVSAQELRLKDDPLLFAAACARLELPPPAVLFVDDWPPHVQTARAAGLHGVVLDRAGDAPRLPELDYFPDLTAVAEMARFLAAGAEEEAHEYRRPQ